MKNRKIYTRAAFYILVTFFLSCVLWFLAGSGENENTALTLAGSSVPSLTGILFIIFCKSDQGKHFIKRRLSFRTIKFRWYLVIFLAFPLILLISYVTLKLLGGEIPSLDSIAETICNPAALFSILFLGFVTGISEEFGWRGFLLDLLQKRFNAFTSALIIGIVWVAWHIPLGIFGGVDMSPFELLIFCLMVVTLSFYLAWIYNNNNGSILAAILAHAMVNIYQWLASGSQPLSPGMNALIVLFLMAFTVILITHKPAVSIKEKPPAASVDY